MRSANVKVKKVLDYSGYEISLNDFGDYGGQPKDCVLVQDTN